MPKKSEKKEAAKPKLAAKLPENEEELDVYHEMIEVKPGFVAQQMGCSQRHVYNLIQQGYLTFSSKGKVYLMEAIIAFYRHKDEKARQERESPLEELERELLQEKIQKARHEAELKRLEVAKLKGQLIEVEQVERQWMVNVLAVQRQLMAAPGKYTPDIYGAKSLVEAQAKFSEAVHELLEEFSRTQPDSGDSGEQSESAEAD